LTLCRILGGTQSPFEIEEQAREGGRTFEQTPEIVCNGKPLNVIVKLYNALLTIREVPQDVAFTEKAGRPRAEYIWIDFICINQNDTAERNAQVAIMDEIYSEARTTIVWLGREDLFALPAVQVLLDICKMPADIIPLMKQPDGKQFSVRDYESVGLRRIQEVEWLSVYAFLNRNWFRRAWILQELALSHRIFVMSGRIMMAWSMLAMSCRILVESHWYDTIARVAECYMEGRSASRFKNLQAPSTHDPEAYKPSLYRAGQFLDFNPAIAICGMTQIRASLGIKDSSIKMMVPLEPADLTILMQHFWYSLSTEPRDKIYALCGLLRKDTLEAQQNIQKIIPDYNKPIEQVYTEAAWFQLRRANNLDFLGHVQDMAKTRVKNQPSYVPNYSVTLFTNSI
jgi:hypothetical protein